MLSLHTSRLFAIIFECIFVTYHAATSQTIMHGTSVVLVRSKDSIIVGADSKVVVENAIETASQIMDKIHVFNHMGFVVAGFYKSGRGDYDIYRYLDSCMIIEENLFQKAARLKYGLPNIVTNAWNYAARYTPHLEAEKRPVCVLLFGFFENDPFFFTITIKSKPHLRQPLTNMPQSFYSISNSFDIFKKYDSDVTFLRYPDKNQIDSTTYIYISDALSKYDFSPVEFLLVDKKVTLVRSLIDIAVSIDPSTNGKPIRILCLTKNTREWLQ